MKTTPVDGSRPPRKATFVEICGAFLYRIILVAAVAALGTIWVMGLYPKNLECSTNTKTYSLSCHCSGIETKHYSACPWEKNQECALVTYCLGKITGRYQ